MMSKTNTRNRDFKKRQCAFCQLADQREMRMGRPHYCGYIIKNKKEPEIRNGHCVRMAQTKVKKERK